MIGPSAAFLAGMMTWVASITGLPVPPTPKIIFDVVWVFHENVQAYEIPGEIHLKRSWDQNNAANRAQLAHELVHIAQDAAHIRYRCDAERECLAYAVEAIYLAKYNVDFWKDHPPRWLANLEECH